MAMLHAENADCIEWLTKRLEATGRTAPRFHAHARPMLVEREATHRAIALSRTGRRADPDRARVGPRGGRADPLGARARPERVRRDLPAVPVPDRRRPGHRRQLPGRALRLQPAAARQGQPAGDLGRPQRRPLHRVLVRPRALQIRRTPRARSPAARRSRSATSRTAFPGIETRCRCCIPKACWPAASRCRSSSSSRPPTRPRPTACIRARARSRWAAMPTW
jgi:hypothetical protein